MRKVKTRGGLAHGRGVTASTQSKMVHILPKTVPMCESLECYSGIHSHTTDQQKDLRATATARDGLHFTKFRTYIAQHSPFSYKGECKDKFVCIATVVVAPATANADRAIEAGEEAAKRLTAMNYADAKLKINDKVISIGAANNSAIVRGHQVEIDPISLFIRVTCVIGNRADMKDHLKHEFSKHPPSLFDNGVMRKNIKSVFASVLKAHVDPFSIDNLQNPLHVIDGGHMLHSVTWPCVCTYQDVINNYVAYVLSNYGPEALVCFDGYSNLPMSTKAAE